MKKVVKLTRYQVEEILERYISNKLGLSYNDITIGTEDWEVEFDEDHDPDEDVFVSVTIEDMDEWVDPKHVPDEITEEIEVEDVDEERCRKCGSKDISSSENPHTRSTRHKCKVCHETWDD